MKYLSFFLLTAAVALASCGGGDKKNDAEKLAELKKQRQSLDAEINKLEGAVPDTARKSTPVKTVPVQRGVFTAYVEVQSLITGDENVNVLPQTAMPAAVTQVLVAPGQRVSKGQVMATLDASSIEQQILAQDAQLTLARTVYQKQQRLWAQKIGSELQLLQAKANYEAAAKQKAATEAQRNTFRIVSPINGTVDQVNVKVGDLLSAQSGAAPGVGIRVVNLNKLKAEAMLGQNYLGQVKTGDPVTIVLPDINDSVQAKLDYVANSVDAASSSFQVQVRLGSNQRLRPNMSARMKIANYRNSNAITVPASVIQKTGEGDIVYVAAGKTARAVKVQTGRVSNGQTEILSGLNDGDLIITEGFQNLDEGSLISTQ